MPVPCTPKVQLHMQQLREGQVPPGLEGQQRLGEALRDKDEILVVPENPGETTRITMVLQ